MVAGAPWYKMPQIPTIIFAIHVADELQVLDVSNVALAWRILKLQYVPPS